MAIKIGTASWTDKTLIACRRFYPAGCSSAEARLRYYASQFPLVEVDSSYYAMPSVQNAMLWAERTPADFVFNVKAFRLLTGHQTGREALGPLWQAGTLGAMLFQFPPWLTSGPEGRAHLDGCVRRTEGYTTAVEFRNKSWFDEKHVASTLAFEREHGVVHVVIDAPVGVTNRAQTAWAVTNPGLAIVRLHGRNAQTWNAVSATSAAARFNYDYNDDELRELAAPIRQLAAQVTDTHVVFNNCYEDYATRNARSLMHMIER